MADTDNDIVVKGGSVELIYDETRYPKKTGDLKVRHNKEVKINRIIVKDEADAVVYDTQAHPEGLLFTVEVQCR